MEPRAADSDEPIARIHTTSSRLLAGAVSGRTLERVRARVRSSVEAYPWEQVVDEILADPVDEELFLQQTLRAQRDWIQRDTRNRSRRSLRRQSKTLGAYLASRLVFFVLYTVAVVILLLLLKLRWPQVDIYGLLDGLRGVLPGPAGGR